jgi:hypothetical protein
MAQDVSILRHFSFITFQVSSTSEAAEPITSFTY